ncbi:hypothetical protein QQF64_022195 [Cirrhinus molitorella]|uniref:ribonuclease H n=1 Tax=Cirrhinus molitorella TaxID=172907 RepID=A0ABR3LB31_9TELE
MTDHPKQTETLQPIIDQDPEVPESAVLVVCLPTEQQEDRPNCQPVTTQTLVPSLLVNELEATVPAYTKGVTVRLNMRRGQTLNHTLAYFQLSPKLPKGYRAGWLVSQTFHDLGLTIPILYQYKASFARDSLDCGLTNLHTVRIPSHPNALPTFVKQYKIPIASHEPVQEIIDSMLEKGIIRPCNSTYSAPIWPVPTIDYRKLNQQVPLSRWPMTQLEQEIPRISGATIFSTVDVASGFWTIPVHPEDQHKLAFTFGNRQYTFNRFGCANSTAEFNIFLNKACPDARMRGNLIYVDDVLMKSVTVDDHLEEIKHVLNQLTTAGAKIALHIGQWCKTKVNYVGLLIGPHGIEPQSSRIQAVQNIKTPKDISELRSFLGVCNYSRQFIENYSDIARPLTSLLKKDCPFLWTDAQDSAPCLAYPNPQKEFYLEAGFSNHCLSAGL